MSKKRKIVEKIIIQQPYQVSVTVEGRVIQLPLTNTHCEVRLIKEGGGQWLVLERQMQPSDPGKSWMGSLAFWEPELDELGWDRMLASRLAFHRSLTLSDVARHTGRARATVKRHFNRFADRHLASVESFDDELILTVR